MKNIQKLMREHKFEDAVGMFRAARFVLSLNIIALKTIYLTYFRPNK